MKKTLTILTIIMMVMSVIIVFAAPTGEYSPNGYFYKPDYGASGTEEWETFNTYIDKADAQIELNRLNSFAVIDTEAELETALTDVNNVYTDNDFSISDYLLTVDNNDTLDDLSDNSIDDLSDVNTTGKAVGKLLKFDASGNLIVGTDESGAGSNTFIELTDTPANYTDAANKFLQVNATPDAIIFDTISVSDVSGAATSGANSDITSLTGLTTPLAPAYGGTGVANGANNNITFTGNYSLGVTLSNNTTVTLPTSGTLLANVVEDTTPELGGELDAGAHSIGFTLQTITADGTDNIDWRLGNHCKVTLGAQNETFTFTAPSNPCNLTLIIIQDSTGGRDITFPASVRWLGDEPTWTDGGANKGIIVGFLYDGTNYWAQATPYEN